jgi:Transposase DNA-binding/Transposase DDE domain
VTKHALIQPREEFARVELGDKRLERRLDMLVEAFVSSPGQSIPRAMKSDAQLEGAYRFFQNERVTLDRLIEPHLEATTLRAATVDELLVVHDTTELRYGGRGRREGLGELANGGQGFFAHFALALDAGHGECLGVAGLLTYRREGERAMSLERIPIESRHLHESESARWHTLFLETHVRMKHLAPIHVMDREADDFDLLTEMAGFGARFVLRSTVQRRRKGRDENGEEALLQELAANRPVVAEREVRLSPRPATRRANQPGHPARRTRMATLEITAVSVDLKPPRHQPKSTPLPIGIVRVSERNPPSGEQTVEWVLMTNEPITTRDEVVRVVDIYRMRWVIEEYFKVLKTGCAIERRQLETVEALSAILGLFVPIAARLLALRSRAQRSPNDPARTLLNDVELAALRVLARGPLPRYPSVQDALLAIAAIGGHLKRNGSPGWLTLTRGFEDLQIAAQVAAALVDEARAK